MRTVAVVGASLAGLSSARQLRRQGYDGRLVVIGAERHLPYDRPPLSKGFLAGTIEAAGLALLASGEQQALDADWRLGRRAVRLSAPAGAVMLDDGTEVRADGVVLATGAIARTGPGWPELAGVHTLRTVDDAVALRAGLRPGTRLVVVGAGFIGSEVAATAHDLGLSVTVVEALPVPLAGPLGVELGRYCAGLHVDHGVRLICGVGVAGLVGGSAVEAVRLADGRLLPADVVVVGVGARPATDWLAGCGLVLDDGVVCDAGGATALPNVVAVGDLARWYAPAAGEYRRVEHWTSAMDQPVAAVTTLLAGPGRAPAPVARPAPYFWSEQYGVRIQFAGHRGDGDTVRVVEGDPDSRRMVAAYERDGVLVAVFAMDHPKLFSRWRRRIGTAPAPASPAAPTLAANPAVRGGPAPAS